MENTSGFYKLDGELLYGPNFVLNANYELRRENYTEYQYPIDNWYWFDSEELAREFFKLPAKDIIEDNMSSFIPNFVR